MAYWHILLLDAAHPPVIRWSSYYSGRAGSPIIPRRARRWATGVPQASTCSLDGRVPLGRGDTADLDLLGGSFIEATVLGTPGYSDLQRRLGVWVLLGRSSGL